MLLREIINKIANYISKTNQYTQEQEEQVEYALRIITFETLKTIGIIMIISLIGYPVQAIIAITAMTISKPYIGGYHEDTQIKCFIATLLVVGSIVYIGNVLTVDLITKLILNIVSLYCIWHQAPVINPKMALNRLELINRNRVLGLIIITVLIITSLVFYKNKMVSDIILWTIVFEALLMFNKRPVAVQ